MCHCARASLEKRQPPFKNLYQTKQEGRKWVMFVCTSHLTHIIWLQSVEWGIGGGSVCWVCEPPYSTRRRVRERSCTLKALILQLRTQSASLMTPVSKHLSPPSSITHTSPSKQCAIVYSMGERKKKSKCKASFRPLVFWTGRNKGCWIRRYNKHFHDAVKAQLYSCFTEQQLCW